MFVYSRRWVGKTFMFKRLDYSLYAIISYDGECIVYDRHGSRLSL